MLFVSACGEAETQPAAQADAGAENTMSANTPAADAAADVVEILLNDSMIQVNGAPVSTERGSPVYTANDIVYYEAGHDFTYGEGTGADAHAPEEAAAHTVLHITEAGTYRISGTLSKGQIAVDLGGDAEEDPDAVVTLILSGTDITCEVAPAVIFYNVYECGSKDEDAASKDADTSAAGANVVIEDGTENTVRGAYVARIYKPESVVLSEDGRSVEDAKKLHKYDGAFYSRMSMNIFGGEAGTGVLNIFAENEGMDSEMHLTVNGGNIIILSGNDGINTNEDGISVTTVNGGTLTVQVTGETGEGDGIDSNGWLVINGGTVEASACGESADAGIDSDMGIYLNGGTVIASGNMLDRIESGGQTCAVFQFAEKQSGEEPVSLKNENGETVLEAVPGNDYSVLIFSSPNLSPGTYTLWSGETQLALQGGMAGGMPGMQPGGMEPSNEMPVFEEREPFEGMEPPEGEIPQDGGEPPEKPGGFENGMPPEMGEGFPRDGSAEFVITDGENLFGGVSPLT